MALYWYNDRSAIDKLYLIRTDKGGVRAYLHARDGLPPATLAEIKHTMEARGWYTVPVEYQGQPALEVRGYRSDKKILSALNENHWLDGIPKKLPSPGDIKSVSDIFQARSLQASGFLYALGDVNFITYGLSSKDPALETAAGFAYACGTPFVAIYGRNDRSDMEVHDLSQRLVTYLQENNQNIPKNTALTYIAQEHEHEKGISHRLDNFFKRYPSEMTSVCFTVAGALVAANALKYKLPGAKTVSDKVVGWMDFSLGACTMASCIAGLSVTEKHHDPDEPKPATKIGQMWRWVQEKPLRLTGYGLMASTLCHAGSTAVTFNQARRGLGESSMFSILNRASFVATNLTAELILSLSSKGHGEGVETDSSVQKSIVSIAAELIAKQDPRLHEPLIQNISRFLGDPKVLGSKDRDIEKELREGLQGILRNPWAGNWKAPVAASQHNLPYLQQNPGKVILSPHQLPQRMMPQRAAELPLG